MRMTRTIRQREIAMSDEHEQRSGLLPECLRPKIDVLRAAVDPHGRARLLPSRQCASMEKYAFSGTRSTRLLATPPREVEHAKTVVSRTARCTVFDMRTHNGGSAGASPSRGVGGFPDAVFCWRKHTGAFWRAGNTPLCVRAKNDALRAAVDPRGRARLLPSRQCASIEKDAFSGTQSTRLLQTPSREIRHAKTVVSVAARSTIFARRKHIGGSAGASPSRGVGGCPDTVCRVRKHSGGVCIRGPKNPAADAGRLAGRFDSHNPAGSRLVSFSTLLCNLFSVIGG